MCPHFSFACSLSEIIQISFWCPLKSVLKLQKQFENKNIMQGIFQWRFFQMYINFKEVKEEIFNVSACAIYGYIEPS